MASVGLFHTFAAAMSGWGARVSLTAVNWIRSTTCVQLDSLDAHN